MQRKELHADDPKKYPCGKNFYKDLKQEFFSKEKSSEFPPVPEEDTLDDHMFTCAKAVIRHN
eukprot:4561696-Prorocentrum_lima.AAC.1